MEVVNSGNTVFTSCLIENAVDRGSHVKHPWSDPSSSSFATGSRSRVTAELVCLYGNVTGLLKGSNEVGVTLGASLGSADKPPAATVQHKPKTFGSLVSEVIRQGRCVGCGGCVASCPVGILRLQDNTPTMAGKCLLCEYCYYQCPHTDLPSLNDIQGTLFCGSASAFEGMPTGVGYYLRGYSAQSTSPEILSRATNGGVVTSLLLHLMNERSIDAAVIASNSSEKPWRSEATVALSAEEILAASGTRFTVSPTLLSLASAVEEYDKKNIAVVALPCQLRAIRKMQLHPKGLLRVGKRIRLTIGLFCMQSFTYEGLMHSLLEKEKQVNLTDITRLHIRKGKLIVHEGGVEKMRIPLEEVKPYGNKGCGFCDDFTSELADLSVGAVGSPEGWSTLLVRTPIGEEVFASAVKSGKLIARSLDDVKPGLTPVIALSASKRKRAARRPI